MVRIRRPARLSDPEIEGLARVLVDCVEDGASVGFMLPLSLERAAAFWQRIGAAVTRGERALLLAEDDAGIVGTVHLVLDQPENQPHRADLSKLLVHRRARRQGVAAALMHAAQALRATAARPCSCSTPSPAAPPSAFTRGSAGSAAASFPAMPCCRRAARRRPPTSIST